VLMLQWLDFAAQLTAVGNDENFDGEEAARVTQRLSAAAEGAGYRLDRFLKELAC